MHSCRESFRHLHFSHASWASWGSLGAHKLDSFQKDTRCVPELHLVPLELLMDVQPPKLAEKSTGKIPGDVYNVNVGWLLPTVPLYKSSPAGVLCLLIQTLLVSWRAKCCKDFVMCMKLQLCEETSPLAGVCWSVPYRTAGKCGIQVFS